MSNVRQTIFNYTKLGNTSKRFLVYFLKKTDCISLAPPSLTNIVVKISMTLKKKTISKQKQKRKTQQITLVSACIIVVECRRRSY